MNQRALALVAAVVVAGLLIVIAAMRWYGAGPDTAPASADATSADTGRKIRATLYYISRSGRRLAPVEREVPYGETTAEQARLIVEEQLKEAPAPLATALSAGTRLRALYVTDRGEAFVDLSSEVASIRTGGSLNELLAVYAIVNALTTNLPAISAVEILVDGREVDTLAGHVDLRHPLQKSLRWVEASGSSAARPAQETK